MGSEKELLHRRKEGASMQDDWYLQRRREIARKQNPVQTKLEVSHPGDAHELQADQVGKTVAGGGEMNVSRMVQHSSGSNVNTKSEGDVMTAPESFQRSLDSSKGGGQKMDDHVQREMESKMGADFSGVNIHTGTGAHGMSESINAKAFTHGQDVYFKNGNYNPASNQGKELLAHELTHTVQQKDGVNRKVMREVDPLKNKAVRDNTYVAPPFRIEKTNSALLAGAKLAKKKPKKTKHADKKGLKTKPVKKAKSIKKIKKSKKAVAKKPKLKAASKEGAKLLPPVAYLKKSKEARKRPKVIDLKTELTKLETKSATLSAGASAFITKQITQLQNSASVARGNLGIQSATKKKEIEDAYDLSMYGVITQMNSVKKITGDSLKTQKEEVRASRINEPNRLNTETDKKVENLKTVGEKLAKNAEEHGANEEKRVRDTERLQEQELALFVKRKIDHYIRVWDAEGRRERMRSNLGDMKDETMEGIKDNDDDLIEEVKEDSAELAERLREEYTEAAAKLPESKEPIPQSINDLADQATTQLDTLGTEPIATLQKQADSITLSLLAQKTASLGKVDLFVHLALSEINKDEKSSIADLNLNLTNYQNDLKIVILKTQTEVNSGNYSKEESYDLIASTSELLDSTNKDFEGKNTAMVALKVTAYNDTYLKTITLIDNLKVEIASSCKTVTTDFSNTALGIQSNMLTILLDARTKTTAGMKDAVDQCLAGMDKVASDSILEWLQELIEGKADITTKVDDVLESNLGMFNDSKDAIDDEAEQLASEWEATYWARQILSVIGDIILFVVKVVLWIIAIVVAVFLLILAIIALVVLIVALVEMIVAGIAYLVGLLLNLIAEGLVALLGPSVTELGVGWAMRLFLTNAFRSAWIWVAEGVAGNWLAFLAVMKNLEPFFKAVAIVDIIWGAGEWAYSFSPSLSAEEKKQLRVDGSIRIVTGVMYFWLEILRFVKGEKPPMPLTPEMEQLEQQMLKDAMKKKAGQSSTNAVEETVEVILRDKAFRDNVFLQLEKVGIKIPKKYQKLFQCHHVIEFNFANDPIFGPFLRKIGFDIENAAQNGIPLLNKPYSQIIKENPKILTEFADIKIWEKLPQHLGPHPPSYNNLIQSKLQIVYDSYLIDKNSDKALSKVNALVDEIIGKFDTGELKLRSK